MGISDNLFEIIKAKNIKIHDLAKKSNVHHSAIYRILKEQNKNPGIYTVKKLADALGISIDSLIK